MIYTLKPNGEYMYVTRPPTNDECNRFRRNGYSPPDLVRESNPDVYKYLRGETEPHYPMPAVWVPMEDAFDYWWLVFKTLYTIPAQFI